MWTPPVIKATFGGELNAKTNLFVGFDTYGLEKAKETGDWWRFFDGFYIRDAVNGDDQPEFTVDGQIYAQLGLSAVVVQANIRGGIEGKATLDLVDVGENNGTSDGKVRGSEIISRLSNPLELFRLAGTIDAFLKAQIKVGLDLGFFEIMKTVYEKEFARVKLFEFSVGGGQPATIGGRFSQSYISGGLVFLDTNFNYIRDEEEAYSITNEDGSYELDVPYDKFDLNGNGILEANEGRLVATGGIDSTSGLPIVMPMLAIPNSKIITPLTTLKAILIELGATEEAAVLKVQQAFGLASDIVLETYDPISNIQAGNVENGSKVYRAHVELQGLFNQAYTFLKLATGSDNAEVLKATLKAVAKAISAEEGIFNFTNPEALKTIFSELLKEATEIIPTLVDDNKRLLELQEQIDDLVKDIANGNQILQDAIKQAESNFQQEIQPQENQQQETQQQETQPQENQQQETQQQETQQLIPQNARALTMAAANMEANVETDVKTENTLSPAQKLLLEIAKAKSIVQAEIPGVIEDQISGKSNIVVSDIPTQNSQEDQLLNLDLRSYFNFDLFENKEAVKFSVLGLPDGLSIDAKTGVINGTPDRADVGEYTVTIEAFDVTSVRNIKQTAQFKLQVAAVNKAPTLGNISKLGQENTNIFFTADDFTSSFSDIDKDALTKIQILSLPQYGTLKLDGAQVQVGQEIDIVTLQGNRLSFTPEDKFSGIISFNWNASDGKVYAKTPAKAELKVQPATLININLVGQGATDVLQLTSGYGEVGNAFYDEKPISLAENDNFSSEFQLQINDPEAVAKGIVFTIAAQLGNGEGDSGMGYAGIANSIGIEFDVSNDGEVDNDNSNHIAINVNGEIQAKKELFKTLPTTIVDAQGNKLDKRLNNGKIWQVWVDYIGKTDTLEVRLADTNTRPQTANLTYTGVREALGTNKGYLGFSGSSSTFNGVPLELPQLSESTSAWGDYDGDGDLDFVIAGNNQGKAITRVYRNDGNNIFTDIKAPLAGVETGSLAWGDYNKDGKLDLLLTGRDNDFNPIAKIYRNDGNNSFTDIAAPLTGVNFSNAVWGDYDLDGDLDILLAGAKGSSDEHVTKVYRNNNGIFEDINANLKGVAFGTATWVDYDQDGKLDIFLTGATAGWSLNYPRATVLYRNQGDGNFAEIATDLPGVFDSAAAWADFDRDGDLDAAISGKDANDKSLTRVYRNDGNGKFTEHESGLLNVANGSLAWGDFDNDGTLLWPADMQQEDSVDLLVTGKYEDGSNVTRLYSNFNGDFTRSRITLPGVENSNATWGDYDKDGKEDLLLTGTTDSGQAITQLYRNFTGAKVEQEILDWKIKGQFTSNQNRFTAIGSDNAPLAEVSESASAWGDYDKDGDLDLVITGKSGDERISRIYRNDGGTFNQIADLAGVESGAVAWGDYDNDGDLDLALAGKDNNDTYITKIYRNNQGTFEDIEVDLPGVAFGSVAWSDYDKDGNLDLLLAGDIDPNTDFGHITKVYRNEGGTFVENETRLIGVAFGTATWADYDKDGYLDIAVTGATSGYPNYPSITKLYRNNQNGDFVDNNQTLTGVENGTAAWADYNKDGKLDIFLTGQTGTNKGDIVELYQNIYTPGSFNNFEKVTLPFPGLNESASAWADYDSDGDLDLVLTGEYLEKISDTQVSRQVATIYRNDNGTFTDIKAQLDQVKGGAVDWGDYDKDGDLDLVLTGWQNIIVDTSATLEELEAQYPNAKINPNNGFIEVVQHISRIYQNNNGAFSNINAPLADVAFSNTDWGDYDSDGDLDLLLAGDNDTRTNKGHITKVYRNDNGIFVDINAQLEGVAFGASAWVDYDNDGKLDVMLSGATEGHPEYPRVTKLYRNSGDNKFEEQKAIITNAQGEEDKTLPNLYDSSIAWGDYDNDGDVDLAISGTEKGSEDGNKTNISRIYRNDGNGKFTQNRAVDLPGVANSTMAWGDYNKDNKLDLLLMGAINSELKIAKLYINNGDGSFTDSDLKPSLPDVYDSALAWGDYDGDSDADAAISGKDKNGKKVTAIYRNDGNGVFNENTDASLPDVDNGSLEWGDYNNDSRLDLLISGLTEDNRRITRIYVNNGNGKFSNSYELLDGVNNGTAIWGDYDNDNNLDILLTGATSDYYSTAKIYRNAPTEALATSKTIDNSNVNTTTLNLLGSAQQLQASKGKVTPLIRRNPEIFAPVATKQTNLIFPYGVMEFNVTDIPVGDKVTIDIPLPKGSKVNNYVKLIDGKWQDFLFDGETGAEFLDLDNDGTLDIRLHLKDGGRGDDDGIANGIIVDPGAPTITENAGDNTNTSQLSVNKGVLSLGSVNTNLLFNLVSVNRDDKNVNEIGLFTVDDDNGTINGIAPGSPGYVAAAITRAKVISSTIFNSPQGFDNNISRLLDFKAGQKVGFYVIPGESTATALNEFVTTGQISRQVFLSTTDQIQITSASDGGFNVNWQDKLQINLKKTNEPLVIGTKAQNETLTELIDLRSEKGELNASFTLHREAAYNNLVGFYKVADTNGTVIDPLTGERISADGANRARYAEVALNNRVQGVELSVGNGQTSVFQHQLKAGEIYAPFLISNGNIKDVGSNFEKVYFAYMGVNSDKVDHIRLLGNNVFGFEDLTSGGDRDYNDIILKASFSKNS